MITIKNAKIFKCRATKPYHWSKLQKLRKLMKLRIFSFIGTDLGGADLGGADLRGICIDTETQGLEYVAVGSMGPFGRTYFYYPKIDRVNAGCFWDTLEKFKREIKKTYTGITLEKSKMAINFFETYKTIG